MPGCVLAIRLLTCSPEADSLGNLTGVIVPDYIIHVGTPTDDIPRRCIADGSVGGGGVLDCDLLCQDGILNRGPDGVVTLTPPFCLGQFTQQKNDGSACCEVSIGDVFPQPCVEAGCGACCLSPFNVLNEARFNLCLDTSQQGCQDFSEELLPFTNLRVSIIGQSTFLSNSHCFRFENSGGGGGLVVVPNLNIPCTPGSCCTLFGTCVGSLSQDTCESFGGRWRLGVSCGFPCDCPGLDCEVSTWALSMVPSNMKTPKGYMAPATVHGFEIDDGGGCQQGFAELVLDEDGYLTSIYCADRSFGAPPRTFDQIWTVSPVLGGHDIVDGYLAFEGIQSRPCT